MTTKGKCPLCGEDNGCYAVLGKDPHKCWCMTASVPKQLLTQIPDEDRNKSCVCKACVDKFKENN
jgi:hypothetical protein